MTNDATSSPRTLQLAEVLDLPAAAPLAEILLNNRGTNMLIDASRVQRLGAQCLQVLLSAAQTWRAEGASLSITNRSPGFVEGLQCLGIPATTFTE